MRVAVDAVFLQRVRRVEHPLDRLEPVFLLALGDVVAGEGEIIENAAGIGPLPEQVVVLEEMVVTERGVRETSVCIVMEFSSMM